MILEISTIEFQKAALNKNLIPLKSKSTSESEGIEKLPFLFSVVLSSKPLSLIVSHAEYRIITKMKNIAALMALSV